MTAGKSPSSQPPKFCSCQTLESRHPSSSGALTLYCRKCMQIILTSHIKKNNDAFKERNRLRAWCAHQLSQMRLSNDNEDDSSVEGIHSSPTQISARYKIAQFRDSFAQLQKRLDYLKRECINLNVLHASKSLSNDERELQLSVQKDRIIMARQELGRLSDSLLYSHSSSCIINGEETHAGSSLTDTLETSIRDIKQKRFHLALQAFEMHRMDVGTEYNDLSLSDLIQDVEDPMESDGNIIYTSQFKRRVREKVLSGIGKIGGLPLPHRGALYKVLRSDVLTSSLRLVASLTQLLARCLGIVLPSPILLRPIMTSSMNKSFQTRQLTSFDLVKLQTDDIITDVTSKLDWYKPQKTGDKKSSETPNDVTTMDDLEELTVGGRMEDSPGDSCPMPISSGSDCDVASNERVSRFPQRNASNIAPTPTSSILSLMESSSYIFSRAFDKMIGQRHQQSTNKHHHQLQHQQQHQHQHQQHQHRNSNERHYQHHNEHHHQHQIADTVVNNGMRNESIARMDNLSVSARLRHASCAIICEYKSGNSAKKLGTNTGKRSGIRSANLYYELKPPQYSSNNKSTGALDKEALNRQEKNFNMGLDLLQKNVRALSALAGVPEKALWPAEAILLNLHSLKLYCMEQDLL